MTTDGAGSTTPPSVPPSPPSNATSANPGDSTSDPAAAASNVVDPGPASPRSAANATPDVEPATTGQLDGSATSPTPAPNGPPDAEPATTRQTDESASSPEPKRGIAGMFARPVWLEARAPFERRALRRSPLWQGTGVPAGEGRPVLIIPGFMSGPHKARQLSHVLDKAGWHVQVARVGFNAGPAYHSVDAAAADLDTLVAQTKQRVTIVGHSRGGQFGRVLAVRHPDLVRRVIAIGAPLLTKYPPFVVVKVPAETLDKAWRLGAFGSVAPEREQQVDDDRYLPFPDEVDLVSIYSRNDGIVDWRYCFDPAAEMVEITGSHLGLVNSITGIEAIANALPR
ncbi:MAG: alpha/beta fold hydrolase [Acidimicrobiales bacterium]